MPKPFWFKGKMYRVESPVPGVGIGTPWGALPKDNTYWQARGHHTGDDYPGDFGADCVAVLAGTIFHYWDDVLGNVQLLYASNGYTYWYCHLSEFSAISGTRVDPGDKIGEIGETGSGARGPHLHFEKRKDHSTNWKGEDLNPTW
jgi:murein DD-endopeptidase MepM/ murein hydrolase activator NlpD